MIQTKLTADHFALKVAAVKFAQLTNTPSIVDGIVNKYFTNADGGLIDSDFKDSNLYNTAYENLGQYLLTMPAGADRIT